MVGYSYTDARAKMLRAARKWPKLGIRDYLELFDQLAPGWKRCRATYIAGRTDGTGFLMDIVWELPGRISVRSWDESGVINRK